MLLFPEPTGAQVNPEHVPELDDAFFSSDPYAYFCARIEALTAEPADEPYHTETGRAFLRLLQLPAQMARAEGKSAAQLQQAVDAIGLRQHVAETLIRMWLAALDTQSTGVTVSAWATLTDQPTQVQQVLERIGEHPGNSSQQTPLDLLYPPSIHARTVPGSDLARAADLLFEWLVHAERLLTRTDIQLAAAHNKVKHGLAVRPRSDLRIDAFVNDPSDGSSEAPVSALQDPVPVIDKPSVLYLSRAPRSEGGPKECLELTCLQVDTPIVLAETFMIATVHAAVFHTAAARYQSQRDTVIGIPPFPTLPLGPSPERLLGKAVTGIRTPVTYRPDGSRSDRESGMGFNHFEFVPMESTGRGRMAQVVRG
jgi:hypothetical protein